MLKKFFKCVARKMWKWTEISFSHKNANIKKNNRNDKNNNKKNNDNVDDIISNMKKH